MPKITFCNQPVSLNQTGRHLVLPEDYRREVDAHWAQINAEGRFFNGPVLVASHLTIDQAPPEIEVSATDYAHYLYAMSDAEREFACRAVFSAAVVITRDNHLLAGRMASHTSSPGQIQCAGGGVELTVDGTLNPHECCRRELAEELGAGFLEYQPLFKPLCIKTGGKLETVGLIYLVLFDGDASQAQSLFRAHREGQLAHGEEPEFDTLLAIPLDPQSVDQFLDQQGDAIVDYLATLLSEHRAALLVDVP